MNVLDLEFPDFSIHPSLPKMNFEQYQNWICKEIIPELTRRGEMTTDKLVADFMRNEGLQTEEWPDFGFFSDLPSSQRAS